MMKSIFTLFIALTVSLAGKSQDAPKGLQVDDKAPMFTSKDQNGNSVNLQQLLEKGPVVLVFYRGQWCPYCNRQLAQLQDSVSFITAKGATLVAVSPEKPENIQKTITKTKATYSVLFDDGLKIMDSYKVTYEVDNAMNEKYKSHGIDFKEANGSNGAHLPVPTVYVVNKKDVIQYVHFDPNYTKRTSVKEILAHL